MAGRVWLCRCYCQSSGHCGTHHWQWKHFDCGRHTILRSSCRSSPWWCPPAWCRHSPWGLAPSSWKVDTQLWQTQKLVYTNLSDADYCSANSSITIRLADIKIIRTLPDFLQIHLLVYVIAFLLFLFKMFSQTLEHKYSNYFTQIFSRRDFLLLIPWLRHSGHLQLRSGR